MTPEEKLAKIAEIFETRTPIECVGEGSMIAHTSTHARHNLEGALIDMDRTGKADQICLKTIRRVVRQLADIENVLKDRE